MTRLDRAGVPPFLILAGSALGLIVVHLFAYLAKGSAPGIGDPATSGAHAYWPGLVLIVALGAAAASLTMRGRARFAQSAGLQGRRAYARSALRVWVVLATSTLIGFVILENAEGLTSTGSLAGLAPLALVGRAAALGPAALATGAIAIGVVALVHAGRVEYRRVLVDSYAGLVSDGVFASGFSQSPWAAAFVRDALDREVPSDMAGGPLRVLEVGCGTGVWLEEVSAWARLRDIPVELAGFDLSPDMAQAAADRLASVGVVASVGVGDLFDAAAYEVAGSGPLDVVMAYDVVQQLPAPMQRAAVEALASRVRPGGCLLIFDHDRRSHYGRVMGAKKWLRRYLGVPLVPRYYIHARYPELERLARGLRQRGFEASVAVESEGRKRVLTARRQAGR